MPYSKSNWFLRGRTGKCPCLWDAHHFPLSSIFYIECTYLILCVYLSPCAWLHCCLQLFAALIARGSEAPACGHMQGFPVGEHSCPFPNRLGNMTCSGQWDRNKTFNGHLFLFLSQFPFSFNLIILIVSFQNCRECFLDMAFNLRVKIWIVFEQTAERWTLHLSFPIFKMGIIIVIVS